MEYTTEVKVTYKVNLNQDDLKRAYLADPADAVSLEKEDAINDVLSGILTYCHSEMDGGTFAGFIHNNTIAEHIGYEVVKESGWPYEVTIAWTGTREEDEIEW